MKKDMRQLSYPEAQTKIQFEHTLISHRMSWLFASQGFLITGYFVIENSGKSNTFYSHYQDLMCIIGLVISISIYCGVYAAHFAMAEWKRCCEENSKDLVLSQMLIHFFGELGSSIISAAFIFFWLDIMLIRSGNVSPYSTQHCIFIFAIVTSAIAAYVVVIWRKFSTVAIAAGVPADVVSGAPDRLSK